MTAFERFTAILLSHEEGYEVFFPHFPGCITEGATIEEALAHAKEAMEAYLESAVANGLDVPEWRSFDQVNVANIDVGLPSGVEPMTKRPVASS